MLGICPCKGAVAAISATKGRIGGANALSDQLASLRQSLLGDIIMDAAAGLRPEETHHMKFAEEARFRQPICRQILIHMGFNIGLNT